MNKIAKNLIVLSFLLLALFTISAEQTEATPLNVGDLVCTTPVSLKSNRLGFIELDWSKVNNATGFTISVLPLGGVCGVTTPLKVLPHINGTPTWYSSAEMLCGLPVCIQVDCCNDRCDQCAIAQDDQYCQGINPGCACKDGKIFDNDYGIKHKCFNADGTIRVQNAVCPAGTEAGCSWQCKTGLTGDQHDVCGQEYEVKCGQGPHTRIVGDQPNYNFCSVEGSLNVDTDKYLISPPGVYQLPPAGAPLNLLTQARFVYQWKCLGSNETCFACKRATCNSDFQGKYFGGDFAKTDLNTLCPDGTGTKPVLNPVTKQWEWDCVGNSQCKEDGKENKNWVVEASSPKVGGAVYSQVDHCSAKQAACGWANAEEVTEETWRKNGGADVEYPASGIDLGDFWCLNGGKVVKNPLQVGPIHNKSGLTETLDWQCVYDSSVAPITCHAGIIHCNPEVQDKNLTQEGFDLVKQLKPGSTYNLCLAGNGKWNNALIVGILNDGKASSKKFNWTCQDKFGGVTKCVANETTCATPPTGAYWESLDKMPKPLCNNADYLRGPVTSSNLVGTTWAWDCYGKFDYKALTPGIAKNSAQCEAYKLGCGFGLNGISYDNWDSFLLNNKGCTRVGATNQANCTGVCNDKNKSVLVNFDADGSKQWQWTCGEDKCNATLNAECGTANGSKHVAAYFDRQVSDDSGGNTFLCKKGMASEPKLDSTGWSWTCGEEKCRATEVKCGAVGSDKAKAVKLNYTAANWNKKKANMLCAAADPKTGAGALINNIANVDKTFATFREVDESEYPNGIMSGREWHCGGESSDVDDQLTCANLVVDCGVADANNFLAAKSDNRIRPKTSDGKYHASFNFDTGVPKWLRCLNAVDTNYSPDDATKIRGAFTWNCADSEGGVDGNLSCVARKDCDWAGPEEDGYATVYFEESPRNSDSAGCWTAEDIKSPSNEQANNVMTWHEAVDRTWAQIQRNGYDGFNHKDINNPKDEINQTGPEQGICPEGWEVPSNLAWHRLENSLDDGGLCDEKRFSATNPAHTYQCNLAATAKSKLGYGLKSRITFAGKDNQAFWTKTTACSANSASPTYNMSTEGNNIDYCPVATEDRQCLGVTLKKGTRYFGGWPFAFYINENVAAGKIGRYGDYHVSTEDWCAGFDVSQSSGALLRCVRKVTKTNEEKCDPYGDEATWQKFYDEYFPGKGFKVAGALIPQKDPNKSNLNFLQYMPQGLTYYDVQDVEYHLYSNGKDPYPYHVESPLDQGKYPVSRYPVHDEKDYDGNWPAIIDLSKDERKTTYGYAIYHAGTFETNEYAEQCSMRGPDNDRTDGMKKCSDYIANNKIKTMTRLERGIYGLYMYWKCGVIIDQKNYTYCTGSRYSTDNGYPYDFLNGAVPGAHWDTTPNFNRFCSFSSASSQVHDQLIRPREVIQYSDTGLLKPCTGIGCYRRPGI